VPGEPAFTRHHSEGGLLRVIPDIPVSDDELTAVGVPARIGPRSGEGRPRRSALRVRAAKAPPQLTMVARRGFAITAAFGCSNFGFALDCRCCHVQGRAMKADRRPGPVWAGIDRSALLWSVRSVRWDDRVPNGNRVRAQFLKIGRPVCASLQARA
jgi:hypothetical protein